jgi:hypothetical protein
MKKMADKYSEMARKAAEAAAAHSKNEGEEEDQSQEKKMTSRCTQEKPDGNLIKLAQNKEAHAESHSAAGNVAASNEKKKGNSNEEKKKGNSNEGK